MRYDGAMKTLTPSILALLFACNHQGAADTAGDTGGAAAMRLFVEPLRVSAEPVRVGPTADLDGLPVLTVSTDVEEIDLAFTISDADGDLVGGRFWVNLDGSADAYAIPGDLDRWVDGGTSELALPVSVPTCSSDSFIVEAWAEDQAGHASSHRSRTAVVDGPGRTLLERGDTDTTASDMGTVSSGDAGCGDLASVGNDGSSYTGDYDFVKFSPDASGTWSVTLDWDAAGSDYDLYLTDSSINVLDAANGTATSGPERATANLVAGRTYYAVVVGWSGSPGDYSLEFR